MSAAHPFFARFIVDGSSQTTGDLALSNNMNEQRWYKATPSYDNNAMLHPDQGV
jgi:hypothetical protein